MRLSPHVWSGLALMATLVPASAIEFNKPEAAIKYRQSVFSVMATHFGDIGAMTKGEKPYDAAAAQQDAAIVAQLASLPIKAFGPGTQGGKAKPAIWSETDKVKAGFQDLEKASAALKVAADSRNLDNLKKAFAETGKTCKTCHDSYKDK